MLHPSTIKGLSPWSIAFFSGIFPIVLLISTLWAKPSTALPKTIIHDQEAAQALEGEHLFSLQWISWQNFGRVNVTNHRGTYLIKGHQTEKGTEDLEGSRKAITMDGVVTQIGTRSFTVDGSLMIRLNHVNKGEPCWRKGKMTFRFRKAQNPSWRMQEKQNPCDPHIDYVDIYVNQNWSPPRITKWKPRDAGRWGIGIIMDDATSHTPGFLLFPDLPIPIYESPRGKEIGSVKANPNQGRFNLLEDNVMKTLMARKNDLREISNETTAVTVYSEKKGYLEVFRKGSEKGAWIKHADLKAHGFKFLPWIDFLMSQKEASFFPRMSLSLREGPSTSHNKMTSLKGKMVNLSPTGQRKGLWFEVQALLYSVHPCNDGKGQISKKWTGWVKMVDDAGFPNVWFPTRGC